MKNCLPIILFLASICFTACQKDKGSGILPAGTWNVVSDSTYSGVGPIASAKVYTGQPGDYFKFSGNTLAIKEGTRRVATATYTQVLDTLKFTYSYLEENGEVLISNSTGTAKYIITTQTSTSMKLMADPFLSPGGIYEEYIILSR